MNQPLLSKVTVDFQQSVTELIEKFNSSIPWENKLNSNIGTVLIDMIAGSHTNSQYYIEFAAREGFLQKAKRQSSVFAGTRALGVRIVRRTPASVLTEFFNPTIQEIYVGQGENFSIEGRNFFTKTSFGLAAGERKQVSIFEGIFSTKTFNVSELNQEFPEIKLGEPGFTVADYGLEVTSISQTGEREAWKLHEGSIFELSPDDKVFLDSTLGDGDVSVLFGDGRFGAKPDITHQIEVKYILTNGVQGNAGLPGQEVSYNGNRELVGTTIESVQGGTGVKDLEYYKRYAPYSYASRKRIVSPPDWYSNIALYPGVGDVSIMSQREIAPNDPTWMKVVRVCILPENGSTWGGVNPNPRSSKWNEFLEWIASRTTNIVQTYNPIPIPVDITVEIFIYRSENREEHRTQAIQRIRPLFKHSPGTLGKLLAVDDIGDAVKFVGESKVPGIDYIKILKPVEDILPQSKLEYVSLKSLNVVVRFTERDQF